MSKPIILISAGKPILAVQYHPEACAVDHPCYLTLFRWLIEEAARFQETRKHKAG